MASKSGRHQALVIPAVPERRQKERASDKAMLVVLRLLSVRSAKRHKRASVAIARLAKNKALQWVKSKVRYVVSNFLQLTVKAYQLTQRSLALLLPFFSFYLTLQFIGWPQKVGKTVHRTPSPPKGNRKSRGAANEAARSREAGDCGNYS